MKILFSILCTGALLIITQQTYSNVELSRILLCVKNLSGNSADFANYAGGSYSQGPWQTLKNNQVYARYVTPFRFKASNTLDDYIYLYYKIGNPSIQGEYKTTDKPKSLGIFKNTMIFNKTAPNTLELFICSIKAAGGTTCNPVQTISLTGLSNPQAYCETLTYP